MICRFLHDTRGKYYFTGELEKLVQWKQRDSLIMNTKVKVHQVQFKWKQEEKETVTRTKVRL